MKKFVERKIRCVWSPLLQTNIEAAILLNMFWNVATLSLSLIQCDSLSLLCHLCGDVQIRAHFLLRFYLFLELTRLLLVEVKCSIQKIMFSFFCAHPLQWHCPHNSIYLFFFLSSSIFSFDILRIFLWFFFLYAINVGLFYCSLVDWLVHKPDIFVYDIIHFWLFANYTIDLIWFDTVFFHTSLHKYLSFLLVKLQWTKSHINTIL